MLLLLKIFHPLNTSFEEIFKNKHRLQNTRLCPAPVAASTECGVFSNEHQPALRSWHSSACSSLRNTGCAGQLVASLCAACYIFPNFSTRRPHFPAGSLQVHQWSHLPPLPRIQQSLKPLFSFVNLLLSKKNCSFASIYRYAFPEDSKK